MLPHKPDGAVFYFGLGALSIKPMREMAPLAKTAAEQAPAIDHTLGEARSVPGLVTGAIEYDWKLAERHSLLTLCRRHSLYFLTPLRRFEEAVAQYRRALETDPLSMMVHFGVSFALYCERRFDDAVEHAARAVDLYPDYWLVHFALGTALAQKGCIEQSIASLETTLRLSPSFAMATGFLAASYARSGNPAQAENMDEVSERSSKQYVTPACFGVYYAAAGQADRMFEFLQPAVAECDPYLTRMDAEPYFDAFRPDVRYQELLARMNLA